MFKNINWRHYLGYAFAAAVLYCIPVFCFLNDTTYSRVWLLYLGNFLFLFAMAAFLLSFNRKKHDNASSMTMLAACTVTSLAGIIFSFILCFLLVSILVPGIYHAGTPEKALTGAPANTLPDKASGLLFMIAGSIFIGNIAGSLFVAMIFPFTLKGDQTKENAPPEQKKL